MTVPAVLGLILVLAAGCAPADSDGSGDAAAPKPTVTQPSDPPPSGVPAQTVRLSLAQPSREATPPPAAAASAEAVTLVATNIDNPSDRAFLVVAELRSPGRPPVRLGTFSPYPADQPGRYVFDWTEPAARAGPGARLFLTLEPLRPAEAGDIALDVAARWGPAGS